MATAHAATAKHYLALIVSIVLNSATLVLLKAVALRELVSHTVPAIEELIVLLFSPAFILAVLAFLGGIYFWVIALKRLDLSLAYPSVAVSYALIALVSWRLFGEEIGVFRWLGIVIIVVGVTLMFLPASHTRPRSDQEA